MPAIIVTNVENLWECSQERCDNTNCIKCKLYINDLTIILNLCNDCIESMLLSKVDSFTIINEIQKGIKL